MVGSPSEVPDRQPHDVNVHQEVPKSEGVNGDGSAQDRVRD
jgi:hypothetical protein